jgi:hypothetical protein
MPFAGRLRKPLTGGLVADDRSSETKNQGK